ncbi:uncharacterized protein UTRI_06266_B [Ustilago trichophora]|uniref:Uncharacterized protein n=1 Tax=Ustilago trichophora TaxID=86804 RepID=A0A5C3EI83_9BASI|nr:uncharacterized protein UTRI_06266_B [Ustilago trichophora]
MSRNASSQPQSSRSRAPSDAASAARSLNSGNRNDLFRGSSPSSETRLSASTQPAPSSSYRDRTANREIRDDLEEAAARRARRQKRREEEAYQVKGWENLYGGGGGKPVFAHTKPANHQQAQPSSTASYSTNKAAAKHSTSSRDRSASTQSQSTSSKKVSSSSRSERASGSQIPPSTAPARSTTSTAKSFATKKRKAPSPSPTPSFRKAGAATLQPQVIPEEQDSDDDFEVVGFSGPAAKRSRINSDSAIVVKASPSPNPPPLKSSQPTQSALLRRSISRAPSTAPRNSPAAQSVQSENPRPPSASASASASASTSREPSQSHGSRASSASYKSGPPKLTPQDVENLTKSAYDAFTQGVSLADHVGNVVRVYSGLLSTTHPDYPAVEQFRRKLTDLGQQLTINDIRLATPTLPSRLAKRFAPVLSAYIKYLKQGRNAEQSNTTATPSEASASGTTATATAAAVTAEKSAGAVETSTTARGPAESPAETVQAQYPLVRANEASSHSEKVNKPASAPEHAAVSSGSAQSVTVESAPAHSIEEPRLESMELNTDAMQVDALIDLGAQHDEIHDTDMAVAGAGRASTVGSAGSPQAFGTPPEELAESEQPKQPAGAQAEAVTEADELRDAQHPAEPEEPEEEEEDELVDQLADELADEQVDKHLDDESALPNDDVEPSDDAQPTEATHAPDAAQTSAGRPTMADDKAVEKEQGTALDQEAAKESATTQNQAKRQEAGQIVADDQVTDEEVVSARTCPHAQTDEGNLADGDNTTEVHIQAFGDHQVDKDRTTSTGVNGASIPVADTSAVIEDEQALEANILGSAIAESSTSAPVQPEEREHGASGGKEVGQSEQQTTQETEQQVEVQVEQEAEQQRQNEHAAEQRSTPQIGQQDQQQDQQQGQEQAQQQEQQHQDAPGIYAESEGQNIEQPPPGALEPATKPQHGNAGEANESLMHDMQTSEESAVDQVASAVNEVEQALAANAGAQPAPQTIGTEPNQPANELAPGTSSAQIVQAPASTDETALPAAVSSTARAESPMTTPLALAPSAAPKSSLAEGDMATQTAGSNADQHMQDSMASGQEPFAPVQAEPAQQVSATPTPSDLDATREARASSLPITAQSEFRSLRNIAQDPIAEGQAIPAVEAVADQQQSSGSAGGRDAASEPPTSQAQAGAGPSHPAATMKRVPRNKSRTMDDRMKTLLSNLANAINRESSFGTIQKLKPLKVGLSTPQTIKDLTEHWQDPAKMIPWDCLQEIGPNILHKNAGKYMDMSTHELMDRVSSKPAAKYLLDNVPERVMTRALMEFPRTPHMIHCWGDETAKWFASRGIQRPKNTQPEFKYADGGVHIATMTAPSSSASRASSTQSTASASQQPSVHERSIKLESSRTPTLAPSTMRTQSNPATPSNAVPTNVPAGPYIVQQPHPHMPPPSISPASSSTSSHRPMLEIGSQVLAAHIAQQYQSAHFPVPPAQPEPVQQPLTVPPAQAFVSRNEQQMQQQREDAAQAFRWSEQATMAENLQRRMQQQQRQQQQQQQKQAEEQRKQAEKQRLMQVQERLRREAEEERRQREQQAEQLRLQQLEQQRLLQQQQQQQSAIRQAVIIKQTVDGVFSGLVADCLSFAEHVIGSRGTDEVTSRDHFSEADVLHVVNYVVGVYKREVDSERSQGRENLRAEERYARILKLKAAAEQVISLTRTLLGIKMCLNEAVSESLRTKGVAATDQWLEMLFTLPRWGVIRDHLLRDESTRAGVAMLSKVERNILLQRQIDLLNKELESTLERMMEINELVGLVDGDGGQVEQEGEVMLRNECFQIAGICCKHVIGILGEAQGSS